MRNQLFKYIGPLAISLIFRGFTVSIPFYRSYAGDHLSPRSILFFFFLLFNRFTLFPLLKPTWSHLLLFYSKLKSIWESNSERFTMIDRILRDLSSLKDLKTIVYLTRLLYIPNLITVNLFVGSTHGLLGGKATKSNRPFLSRKRGFCELANSSSLNEIKSLYCIDPERERGNFTLTYIHAIGLLLATSIR